MEKIIYALWRDSATTQDQFNEQVTQLASELAGKTRAVRINLQDAHVAMGNSPRLSSTRPQMEAVMQLWVDSAHDVYREPIDRLIGEVASRFSAWLVTESTPLVNTKHPPAPGKRTEGFSQMVFLGLPPRLSWTSWRQAWERGQTQLAMDTQDTFEYVQHLVIRPLTYAAPAYAAIVEECFPHAALTDEAVYFDAVGNPALLAENQARMAESCARFMDFDRIDCIPTSQYVIKEIGD